MAQSSDERRVPAARFWGGDDHEDEPDDYWPNDEDRREAEMLAAEDRDHRAAERDDPRDDLRHEEMVAWYEKRP